MTTLKNTVNIVKGYLVLYRDLTRPSVTSEIYSDCNTALTDACLESECYENIVVSVYKLSLNNDLKHIASFYHGRYFTSETEVE